MLLNMVSAVWLRLVACIVCCIFYNVAVAGATGFDSPGKQYISNSIQRLMSFAQHGAFEPTMKENVIFGFTGGNDTSMSSVFERVKDLQTLVPNADIVLFVSNSVPSDELAVFASSGVVIVEILPAILFPPFLQTYHYTSQYYVVMNYFLSSRPTLGNYSRMLIMDVVRIRFNLDPFRLAPQTVGLIAATSPEMKTIQTNKFIATAVINCFGDRIFDIVKTLPTLNSGFVLSAVEHGKLFLKKMSRILIGKSDLTVRGLVHPTGAADDAVDGVFNVIMHLGLVPNTEIVNCTSSMATAISIL